MTRAWVLWMVMAAAVVVAVAVVGLPVWLIQPFGPQTPDAVAMSWQLRRAAPGVTGALALVVLAAVAVLWSWPTRERRRLMLRRTALVVIAGVAFGATWFARHVDLLRKLDAVPARYIDEVTGSEFDFAGRPVSGPLTGQQLTRVPHLSDCWFDWREYHQKTSI